MVTVKNVKEAKFMSKETRCFTASVYFDGKRVGTAENQGRGGSTSIFPVKGKIKEFETAAEWALAQPPQEWEVDWKDEPMIVKSDLELIVDDLVAKYLDEKDWKRRCKNKTYFRLEGDEEGHYRTVNHPYDQSVKEWMNQKYDSVIEVVNERFLKTA